VFLSRVPVAGFDVYVDGVCLVCVLSKFLTEVSRAVIGVLSVNESTPPGTFGAPGI
jgi:hypothetical protein